MCTIRAKLEYFYAMHEYILFVDMIWISSLLELPLKIAAPCTISLNCILIKKDSTNI